MIGGSGFYAFLDDADEVEVDDAVRTAQRPADRRRGRGPPGRVPAPARARPPVPAAPDPLPGQPVGAALARRPAGARPVRGRRRCAAPTARARWSSPTSSSTGPAARVQTYYDEGAVHVSFADPYCPVGRAAVLDAGRARRGWAGRRRHAGRHRGPAVLDPRGVAVVRRARAGRGRHDRPPRGGPGPRAGPLLHRVAWSPTWTPASRSGEGVTHDEVLEVFAQQRRPAQGAAARRGPVAADGADCPCGVGTGRAQAAVRPAVTARTWPSRRTRRALRLTFGGTGAGSAHC